MSKKQQRITIKDRSFRITNSLKLIVLSFVLGIGTVFASDTDQQQSRNIKGKVTDVNGEAIPGVSILVKGTTVGNVTDMDGNYSVSVTGNNAVLVFSYISYISQEVAVGNRSTINIILRENVEQLEEVVVTALGIKRSEKALGYSVAQLGEESVTTAKSANMINSLSGKVSGVNVRASASDPGSTVLVNIRGQRSLSGDNQPLIVLDGVPVNNSIANTASGIGGNRSVVDYGNPISDINPDDVASISVLKGAAAAALYGSRAANGVILITSKSGAGLKKGIGISINSSIALDKAWQFPELQNTFGSGTREGTDNVISDASWGPRLDNGTKYVQWDSPLDANGNPIPTDWVSYPNRVKDFFRLGTTFINNVALNYSQDKGNFRLSYTNMNNRGILPNTDLKRNNVNLSGNFNLHPNFRINTNVAYTNNHSDNRPTFNRGSAVHVVYTQPANIDIKKLKNYWKPGLENIQQNSPVPGGNDNPYFVVNELTNGYDRDRITGNIQLTWDITPEWSIMGRTGLDYYVEKRETKGALSGVEHKNGYYSVSDSYFREQNSDFLITYKKNVTPDWFVSVSAGANRMDQSGNSMKLATNKLIAPGVYNISNAVAGTVQSLSGNSRWKKRINSMYAMGQIAFKNYIFLDITARNDWSSTLPPENNSYFYPSASLSVLLSDMIGTEQMGPISYMKLRGNISQVGSDIGAYNLYNTVDFSSWGDYSMASLQRTLKNDELKPEISTSFEIGTDIRFWGNRLGIDFTYYHTNIKNQVMNVSTTASSGYDAISINAGKIRNSGVEITLSGIPVQGEFTWDIMATFTRNRNKIIKLGGGITEVNIGGGDGVEYYAREGYELGDMYARTWKKVPEGPYAGEPLLTASGYVRENEYVKIGNYNPDFMIGFTNTFTYKGFTLTALIDWRQGGDFYSYAAKNLLSDGRVKRTLPGRDAATGGLPWVDSNGTQRNDGMLLPGYFEVSPGEYVPNTDIYLDPESYYGELYWSYNERSTFDATYVKLRELALDYKFSKKILGNLPVNDITVGFWGRDLFSWTKADEGFDPETSMTFTSTRITPGVGGWVLPNARTFGFKVGISF